ncbi:major capsid protein [Dipodfec virus UOA04_Rod_682]|nr:major capsid protein [Dipodfec virus UOA04_Rod_682]
MEVLLKMSSNKYDQVANIGDEAHFTQAMTGTLERSRMTVHPQRFTTFNAGDIVPVYCGEVLPNSTFDFSLDFVIRQTTLKTPTMGSMCVDFYAFFVPNRIVNTAFPSVMGENVYGTWTANSVSLAPLLNPTPFDRGLTIPVQSVADYYDYPTQGKLTVATLNKCHDLKFRGYIEIYNEYFRDQNYQPPVPYSKLNVYEGFFEQAISPDTYFSLDGTVTAATTSAAAQTPIFTTTIETTNEEFEFAQNNSVGAGAIAQAVYGNLKSAVNGNPSGALSGVQSASTFNAAGKPLKANKLHDYFTSVLPNAQKGASVFVPQSLRGPIRIATDPDGGTIVPIYAYASAGANNRSSSPRGGRPIGTQNATYRPFSTFFAQAVPSKVFANTKLSADGSNDDLGYFVSSSKNNATPDNLAFDTRYLESTFDIGSLRMAAATQQVYETLARCGSRYREFVRGFFALEVDDPFKDIPEYLGHFRRTLELYQTAQTSASEAGSTAQGNLAAFGYTNSGGKLFTRTFFEHGYIHVFAVVRQKNIYSSFLGRDNFRQSLLDFYTYPLANISEQPVYLREINPFYAETSSNNPLDVFGYQEAWAEYRFDPDRVSGYMRPGISESLSVWNYADDYDSSLRIADGDWLKSNAEDVLNRTLVVTSDIAPQFKAQMQFHITKDLPMPTYSVPGLDIL